MPLLPDVMDIQLTVFEAVHLQFEDEVVTVILPVPPPEPNDAPVAEREYVHGTMDPVRTHLA